MQVSMYIIFLFFIYYSLVTILSNSTVVLLSRDPPKLAHAPKTATHKMHPADILCEEKHIHGIALALLTPNIAF